MSQDKTPLPYVLYNHLENWWINVCDRTGIHPRGVKQQDPESISFSGYFEAFHF